VWNGAWSYLSQIFARFCVKKLNSTSGVYTEIFFMGGSEFFFDFILISFYLLLIPTASSLKRSLYNFDLKKKTNCLRSCRTKDSNQRNWLLELKTIQCILRSLNLREDNFQKHSNLLNPNLYLQASTIFHYSSFRLS